MESTINAHPSPATLLRVRSFLSPYFCTAPKNFAPAPRICGVQTVALVVAESSFLVYSATVLEENMYHIGRSSNGRTAPFEGVNLGSIPSLPAKENLIYYLNGKFEDGKDK